MIWKEISCVSEDDEEADGTERFSEIRGNRMRTFSERIGKKVLV